MTPQQQHTCLDCSRKIADWLCLLQRPLVDDLPPPGYLPYQVRTGGEEPPASNWNYAFASMGLLTAFKTFQDPRYEGAGNVRTDSKPAAIDKALTALVDAQSDGRFNPRMRGGIIEYESADTPTPRPDWHRGVIVRSSCYALIVLPKLATGSGTHLTAG